MCWTEHLNDLGVGDLQLYENHERAHGNAKTFTQGKSFNVLDRSSE
jgi:hypothetical protein